MDTNKNKRSFLKNEAGDIGIKQIAITVAVIIIIGAAIGIIQGKLGDWITTVWNLFIDQIKGLLS